jgi:hypothetical protein
MNIRNALLKEHSKAQALRIASYIASDASRFKELMTLFLGKEYRVTQRAAWVVSTCIENYPALITPWLKKMLVHLGEAGLHPAVKRNTLRVLQFVNIPKPLQGIAASNCFLLLQSETEPVAVKVFSMTVLGNLCQKEPDLINELRLVIEHQLIRASAGFKSRAKKILRLLEGFDNRV